MLTRDRDLPERPIPHWQVGVLVVVGVALPVVGGVSWLTVTGIVAACFAAYLPRWAAVVGVLAAGPCSAGCSPGRWAPTTAPR